IGPPSVDSAACASRQVLEDSSYGRECSRYAAASSGGGSALGEWDERREVPLEVARQAILVLLPALHQQRLQLVAERVEGAAERHVQHLPRIVIVEQGRKLVVRELVRSRHGLEPGADQVALAVGLE